MTAVDLLTFAREHALVVFLALLVFVVHGYYSLRTRFLNAELLSEIAQKNQLLERLEQLATRDELTGLPNRKLTLQLLRKEVMQSQRTGARLALLYIDIDQFKTINEQLGHSRGDQLLHDTGNLLEHLVRGNDLAGRIGGDEFIVLLSDINSAADAEVVADKLVEHIAGLSVNPPLGVHVGILVFQAAEGTEVNSLLSQAESLLQQARESREGRLCLLDTLDQTKLAV